MRVRIVPLVIVLLTTAAIAGWWISRGGKAVSTAEIVLVRESALGTPLTASGCLALSPDGSQIAFITSVDGRGMLAIASLAPEPSAATIVPGTEDARHPSWSADGRRVAFATHARGPLRVVDLRTHLVTTVAAAGAGGSAWNTSGDLLYTMPEQGLGRIDPSGRAIRLTMLDPGHNEVEHAWPTFLPDGTRFIYLARASRPSDSRLYLSSLDAPHDRRVVAEAHSAPLYADGRLLFVYEGILMAQPFDAERGRVTGLAVPLAVGVLWDEWSGEGSFAAAHDAGLLVYRLARQPPDDLVWFTIGSMTAETVRGFSDVHEARRSPDGLRIAATRRDPATGMDDIWVTSHDGGEPLRVTSDPASDNSPVWSRDGQSIVFRSNRTGIYNLYRLVLPAKDGSHTADAGTLLLESTVDDQPTDMSSNGELLLFNRWSMDTRQDVWALPLAGGDPFPVLVSEFLEANATFSPGAEWMAYETNESGAGQVHVRRYPLDRTSVRISANGGRQPRWTRDGRTVIYVRDDNRFEAVELEIEGETLIPSPPRELFTTRPRLAELGGFDIDADGTRILAPTSGAAGTPESAITIIRNWTR